MGDPREKKFTTVINVPCSATDKAMAQQLATEMGLPMAHLVRRSLKLLHLMTFSNQPHCVNGTPCKCAQLHVIRQSDQMTDEERVIQAQHTIDRLPVKN